jgi:hypothetical protein
MPNQFAALFKSPVNSPYDNDFPTLGQEKKTEPEKSGLKSENISRTSAKKTPTKIMLGHRSYEDELREKDSYYEQENTDQRTSVYDILADKEKLASTLIKSKMCSSVDKNEECQHGEDCRFAHSLDELKISNCLFEQRCRFVRMSNGNLVNNGVKVCSHKHPHETKEAFMSRTGLDRYKSGRKTQPQVSPQQAQQPQVAQPQQPTFWQPQQPQVAQPQQPTFWQPPQPQVAQPQQQPTFWQQPQQPTFWQPPPPQLPVPQPLVVQPSVDQQCQTNKVAETITDATTLEQILVIRVPKELANQALEIAMKSGKSRIQIEIVN